NQAQFRACTHGTDVADNPADTCGCALEWFNRARMIVALHLKRDGPTIADIDNPCIFLAGFYQNARPCSWKFLQFFLRVFIGAMLTPHYGENSQLSNIWLEPDDFLNPLQFLRREPELFHESW